MLGADQLAAPTLLSHQYVPSPPTPELMAPIRIYERSSAPDGGGPQRFSDIDQVGDLLRPGSIVCLASNAEDVLVAERDGGPTSASWRLAVRPTGWSARGKLLQRKRCS